MLKKTICAAVAFGVLAGCAGGNQAAADGPRTVVLGGTLTEIVYALGAEDQLVAVDESASYPPAVDSLPKVGMYRQVSAEGVLGYDPTLVLALAETGPEEAVQQLKNAGVDYRMFGNPRHPDSTKQLIRDLAEATGTQARGTELIAQMDASFAQLDSFKQAHPEKPKVLFIYARGAGTLLVAGTGTSAATMIELAGCENAITGYADYKPLSPEAVVTAQPDYILMVDSGLESVGGLDGLKGFPGVAETPAYQNGNVISMDQLYLLGFGPRMAEAALELAQKTHPALSE